MPQRSLIWGGEFLLTLSEFSVPCAHLTSREPSAKRKALTMAGSTGEETVRLTPASEKRAGKGDGKGAKRVSTSLKANSSQV